MTDISVIILVGREELHIRRCLEKLAPLEPRQVFVVESQTGDRTHEIVEAVRKEWPCGNGEDVVATVFHPWPGNQAAQFNWALDALPIEGEWILRLDADEYLTEELIAEIKRKLGECAFRGNAPTGDVRVSHAHGDAYMEEIAGVVLKRRYLWRGVWVKRGMYPARILRLFRKGLGRSDDKLMDEHVVVRGRVVEFENDFVDHSLISVAAWEAKHLAYAKREAKSFLSGEGSTGAKARLKWSYYHLLPPWLRPWVYYVRRAFVSGAYFESPEARDFTYRHALWYRRQVEREIREMRNLP